MKTKNLLTTFIALIIALNAIAQPFIKAQKVAGGNDLDDLTCMTTTSDKGIIAGGLTYSGISGDKTDTSRGLLDYWIIKFDSIGNKMWDKTMGGSEDDRIVDIHQTADGGYILGGTSESDISGEKTQNKMSYRDFWIIKLDAAGNIEWDKTVGRTGDYYSDLGTIQQTIDGGYIIGGTLGYVSVSDRGGSDYFIVKLDANGNTLWDKAIGGNRNDGLKALQQTRDGGYILGGTSGSNASLDKSENTRGGQDILDYWIVKLDATGNQEWDKTIGGNSYDFFAALQQTTDGGYIIGGHSTSGIFAEKTKASRGFNDYWVVKLNNLGDVQWDNVYGSNQTDQLTTLLQTRDHGYIFGGYSYFGGISGDKTETYRGYEDYWVVKTDSLGNKQWDKTAGGSAPDLLYSVKEIKRNVFLLGGSSSSLASGDKTRKPIGSYDFWFVLLDARQTPGIGKLSNGYGNSIKSESHNSILIYPNPAKDILHIQNAGKATVTLTDQSGNVILTKTINGNGAIDVSKVPSGTYFLTNIITGVTTKVIVNR